MDIKLKDIINNKFFRTFVLFIVISTSIVTGVKTVRILKNRELSERNFIKSNVFNAKLEDIINSAESMVYNYIPSNLEIENKMNYNKSKLNDEKKKVETEYKNKIMDATLENDTESKKQYWEKIDSEVEKLKTKYPENEERIVGDLIANRKIKLKDVRVGLKNLENIKFIIEEKTTKSKFSNTDYKDLEAFRTAYENSGLLYVKNYGNNLVGVDEEGNKLNINSNDFQNYNLELVVINPIEENDQIYEMYNNYKINTRNNQIIIFVFVISLIILCTIMKKEKIEEDKLLCKDNLKEMFYKINKIKLEIRCILILFCLGIIANFGLIIVSIFSIAIILLIISSMIYHFRNLENKVDFLKASYTWDLIIYFRTVSEKFSFGKKINLIFIIILIIECIAGIISILSMHNGNILSILFLGLIGFICEAYIYVYFTKQALSIKKITVGTKEIANGNLNYKFDLAEFNEFLELASNINNIGEGLKKAIENEVKSERMKAELITNVSHDLKTPLTSIINYVDILKKEKLTPEYVQDYILILDKKSQRLKVLIQDLFEISKANSGNVELSLEKVEVSELLNQSLAELDEKIKKSKLNFKTIFPKEKTYIIADGKKLWRVFENIIGNAIKYSLENTRVFIDLIVENNIAIITVKNISKYELNFKSEEIMERFKRGDEARSTEGSGLGIAIAKSLVEIQNGKFNVKIDGDMFKVQIKFKIAE
ncbi:sensor histidine kinase [Clostridium ihumii]|uniref:sensor histidine kinase n=1 Tax=Clostridium ihumii TaxID=1470356 RepID=UPI0006858776|nr:HAMP domain-containing sensor histidine kinase [Clostridium ihumii]